jgi:D-amino-acid dehydrogenase
VDFLHGTKWVFMKIAVIGAGIVGMGTAYELALDGHSVSVFERNAAVAEEASFACAGHVGASLLHPLSFPAWPTASRLRSLLTPSGISLGHGSTLRDVRWLKAWKSPGKDFAERFACAQTLSAYSLQRLHTLSAQASLVFEQSQGHLVLFRSEAEQLAQKERLQWLSEAGSVGKLLTPAEIRVLEPALAPDLAFHSGVYFAQDGVGNCRQFTQLLKEKLLECGAVLHFGTPVTLHTGANAPQLRTQNKGDLTFDRIVVCAGASGTNLVVPGLKHLSLARVWSTSVSAQIREPLNAPRSGMLDWHTQISVSRVGARVRVSGGAFLGHKPGRTSESIQEQLFQTLQSHFPGAADFSRNMQIWQGASLFSPDALPLIGPTESPGVWLNMAHGHNGWSMACGAARIVADQIAGKAVEMDTTKLNPGRFKS